MVFHFSLSTNKFPQVSRTLPSILANLKNAVVWMLSTCPLISKSSIPFTISLEIVPSAPMTTGITVTFCFCSQATSMYLSLFSLSFKFIPWSAETPKFTIRRFSCCCCCCCKLSLVLVLSFTPLEFFTSVFSGGFSLEFEWQQVS